MTNTELIRELRALTSAGMKDCKEALEQANWDLQQAVDLVKVKGLNIADGRTGRVASEGRIGVSCNQTGANNFVALYEINSQTDFVSNSRDFINFVGYVGHKIAQNHSAFQVSDVEDRRQALVATTKENIVVRRWWIEEALSSTVKIFSYLHSNNKIGVLLTLQAPSETLINDPSFIALGEDLAMQVAAMNPLVVSVDRLSPEQVERQKSIFQTQLEETNKPQAAWAKIMDGKLNKWHSEVCLLQQASVIVPKLTIKQVIDGVAVKLGGEITVVNFIRCQVGEGIEVKKDNLAEEVAKLTDQTLESIK